MTMGLVIYSLRKTSFCATSPSAWRILKYGL